MPNIIMCDPKCGAGEYNASDWLDATKPTGLLTSDEATIAGMVDGRTGNFQVSLPNAKTIPANFAKGSTGLTSFVAPNLTSLPYTGFQSCTGLTGNIFCPKAQCATSCLEGARVENAVVYNFGTGQASCFKNNPNLKIVDVVKQTGSNSLGGASTFASCSSLTTIILRSNTVVSMVNVNDFTGTPFDNGGTGGTIYIPKSLYDHLGDGTANDYKAASGWSTVDGYGTITWAKIEGSTYETHYGDGTLIPSA